MADKSRPEDAEGEGHVGETYDPSSEEVSNARIQGVGVGQKDLNYQRDPTRRDSSEKRGD
jgi:hypothetical protein